MLLLSYTKEILKDTIDALLEGGQGKRECIALWLGKKTGNTINIKEVHRPQHYAEADYFHINRASMLKLQEYIRKKRLIIGAQVHTHPGRAYHSKADDDWAFVRHVDAISVVLPNFAQNTNPDNFMQLVEVYALSNKNTWDHLSGLELNKRCVMK